jgi:hypothetical protein
MLNFSTMNNGRTFFTVRTMNITRQTWQTADTGASEAEELKEVGCPEEENAIAPDHRNTMAATPAMTTDLVVQEEGPHGDGLLA